MPRFILRYQDTGAMPQADVLQLQALPETRIVDQSARMLMVEGQEAALAAAERTLPDWSCIPGKIIPLPKPRPVMKAAR